MMRKLIISRIKKRIGVDKFVNMKFTVYKSGKIEVVVNLEKYPDQQLNEKEIKELQAQAGAFDEIVADIEQTKLTFKIKKNEHWEEVHF